MTALTEAYKFVLPSAPGCPGVVALHHIREAAIEFFQRTHAWKATLPEVLSRTGTLTLAAPLVAAQAGTLSAPWAGETRIDYELQFDDGSRRTGALTNGSTAVTWVGEVTAGTALTYWQVLYTIPPTANAKVVKLIDFDVDGYRERVITPDHGAALVAGTYFGEMRGHPDVAWTPDCINFRIHPKPDTSSRRLRVTVSLRPSSAATTLPDDLFEKYVRDIAKGALGTLLAVPEQSWTSTTRAKEKAAEFIDRCDATAALVSRGFSSGRNRIRGRFF